MTNEFGVNAGQFILLRLTEDLADDHVFPGMVARLKRDVKRSELREIKAKARKALEAQGLKITTSTLSNEIHQQLVALNIAECGQPLLVSLGNLEN